MPACEIYSVVRRNAVRWKWRHAAAGGAVVECTEEFERFSECIHAARASGYEPRTNWARAALLAVEK